MGQEPLYLRTKSTGKYLIEILRPLGEFDKDLVRCAMDPTNIAFDRFSAGLTYLYKHQVYLGLMILPYLMQ